jgi:glutamyl-tRNA(Gln) amidotransferase subunit E
MLVSLVDKAPRQWDEIVDSLAKKYHLNRKLASQIFDSDYLNVFEEIASESKIEPTFIAAKLTEDLTSLQRQGLDISVLTNKDIKDVFKELDNGSIPKEAVVLLFEVLIKANSRPKCDNCKIDAAGARKSDGPNSSIQVRQLRQARLSDGCQGTSKYK